MSQTENQLTPDQFQDWLTHPVTLQLRRHWRLQLEELKTRWSQGNFTAAGVEATALLNANAIGQCEVLTNMIDLEQDQLQKASNE